MGLQTETDLEDERMRGASVSSLFSLSLFSRSECLRDRFPDNILQIECSVEGQRPGTKYHPQKTETQ